MENQETSPLEPKSPKTMSRQKRIMLIVGGLIGLPIALFICLVIYFATAGPHTSSDSEAYKKALAAKPGETNGPYYERAGYARKDLGPTIADAEGADFSKTDDTIKLKSGIAIVQACTLLTPGDVKKSGLQLTAAAQSDRSFLTQSYIDGRGQGSIATDDLYNTEDANTCRYAVKDITNYVSVHVAQDFQTKGTLAAEMLQDKTHKIQSFPGLESVEVYQIPDDDIAKTGYILHAGQTYAKLEVSLFDKKERQQKAEALAKQLAANLLRVNQNPTGQMIASYRNSPTFKTSYLRACTVLDEDGLKTLGFEHASAYVTETISTATGVATFSSLKDKTPYVYVENKCTRGGVQADKNSSGHVDLKTTTYTSANGAQQHMQALRVSAKDQQDAAGLADEAIVTTDKDGAGHIAIRKDRLVIDIAFTSKDKKPTNAASFKPTIQPLAEYVLSITPDL